MLKKEGLSPQFLEEIYEIITNKFKKVFFEYHIYIYISECSTRRGTLVEVLWFLALDRLIANMVQAWVENNQLMVMSESGFLICSYG